MEKEKLLTVEKTFNERVESKQGVEAKLELFKRFYYWVQKQNQKIPNGEEYDAERATFLNVEFRLIWNCLNVVFEASKQGEKIKFNKLASNWDTTLTKYLYEFIDWHRTNVTKKGGLMVVSNEVRQSYISSMTKLLKAAVQADFYQMMYIYMQLYLNDMMDFKSFAHPPKKEVKQATSNDEPFLCADNELFKSEEEQPVFWHCIVKKHVTIQDCIDENLLMDYLCWPRGCKAHAEFIIALPPMHYTNVKGYGINWERTYKGETLRSINEKIMAKQKQESKELTKEESEAALDDIDVSWLVGEDKTKHPKVAKQKENPFPNPLP